MGRVVYWVAAGSLLAGVGTLYLIAQLWTYRERPGARWFLASMLAQTVWCLGYGVALLVSDPLAREALEALTLAAMPWTGVCYLGFSLGYTGRSDQIDSVWFRLSLAAAGAMSLLVVTNPVHGLLWREFLVTPIGGIAFDTDESGTTATVRLPVEPRSRPAGQTRGGVPPTPPLQLV